MQLARRLGGTTVIAITVGCAFVLWRFGHREGPVRAAPGGESAPASGPVDGHDAELSLVGFVLAPGLDPTRCRVRCFPLAYEPELTVREARLDARGGFELAGLADRDYCVELRCDPAPGVVLVRRDSIRPGGEDLVLEVDPLALEALREASRGRPTPAAATLGDGRERD